jgi:hypothetical protein
MRKRNQVRLSPSRDSDDYVFDACRCPTAQVTCLALLADSAAEAASAIAAQSPSPIKGGVNGLADVDEQALSPATAKEK